MIAQFTVKTTNSEKAIYFLSLVSCSINKLRSEMFFTCKTFMFSDFTSKKIFCSRKWWWGGEWRPPAPPFPYSPVNVDNRNTTKMFEIYSKLTIKIPGRSHWHRSGVFMVNFEQVSWLFVVFLLLDGSCYWYISNYYNSCLIIKH